MSDELNNYMVRLMLYGYVIPSIMSASTVYFGDINYTNHTVYFGDVSYTVHT